MLLDGLVSLKTLLKATQNQSLSSEICSGSSHEIRRSLPIVFFQRNWPRKFPRNSREIPAKFPQNWSFFSANLALKIPRNLTFFPTTYQKPCFLLSFLRKTKNARLKNPTDLLPAQKLNEPSEISQNTSLLNFLSITCQVDVYRRLKQRKILLLAPKVVAVTCEKWSLTRGSKYNTNLIGKL